MNIDNFGIPARIKILPDPRTPETGLLTAAFEAKSYKGLLKNNINRMVKLSVFKHGL